MASLFKYVSEEQFGLALIERGEVFMQTLATFRSYEDADVRRDPDDGRLRYEPTGGLPINFEGRPAEAPWAGWRLTSSAKEEDIFAYCLSTERTEELAERFKSPFCVEIKNAAPLVGRIRRSVRLRAQLDHKHLPFGLVDYRNVDAVPAADWALPDKVALMKPEGWSWQREFRILAGKKGAFDVHNVRMMLESGPRPVSPLITYAPLVLSVGNISQITTLHRF